MLNKFVRLRYDNKSNSDRIILFVSDTGLEILALSFRWNLDGTFKMAPKFFKQVVTIRALHKNKYFVCAYMLLPKKDQLTYETVFGKLKEILLKEKGKINLKVSFFKLV